MIHVTLPPPPGNYVADVQRPGEAFIRATPNPTPIQWNAHRYWQLIHDDLYIGLRGICSYCASWSPRSSRGDDHTSIDHYVPKSRVPRQAYSWVNFRLCRERLNHRKDMHFDVLDPCVVPDGIFVIDFLTFRLDARERLPGPVARQVKATIDRLQLNTDREYVNERIRIIRAYSLDEITAGYVQERYPFIGQQMVRQDFDANFKTKWRDYFKRTGIRV